MSDTATITTIPGTLAAGMIQVCAWCLPGDKVFDRFPEWRNLGLDISHGICQPCKAKMLAAMKQANKKQA